MRKLAWINGNTVELAEAFVSVEDRGFLFGDGVYDACRIYGGNPFHLEQHLQRLQRSAAAIMLELPYSLAELESHVRQFIEDCACAEGYLYIQLTRGAAPRTHDFPRETSPTLIMFVPALPPDFAWGEPAGMHCATMPDDRWLHCNIKSVNLLPNVLAKEKASRAGAAEAILYRPGDLVTEGTRSNVFAVIDGVVRTHPESNLILSGITRRAILDIMQEAGVEYREEAFTLADLKRAPEIWLCSSVAEISPVTVLDGEPAGGGKPGEIVRDLIRRYRNLVRETCKPGY